MNTKKIIITGAPGTGKSSLLEGLAKRAYTCTVEVARRVIKEQMRLKSDLVPWMDLQGFSALVLEQMLQEEAQYDSAHVRFYDRGIPDIVAYLNKGNCSVEEAYLTGLNAIQYHNKVFIAPPWKEIYRQDEERKEEFEDALLLHEELERTYSALGFELIEIPKVSIDRRVAFVEGTLGEFI